MAWYEDNCTCDYFRIKNNQLLIAIGWLESEKMFNHGQIFDEIYARLESLLENPWQPWIYRGLHECSLCVEDVKARGYQNLFIPGDGVLYVCPEMILHYIKIHQYQPPDEFCNAVLNCPDCDSTEYIMLIRAIGIEEFNKEIN